MITIIIIFILGYIGIAAENFLRINKAATALVTGVLCWTVFALFENNGDMVNKELSHHLADLSQIIFFLMGAMTIVELIDAHDGFDIITNRIHTLSKRKLLWIIGIVTFILSSVLNNLTTAIVMVSLVRKLVSYKKTRLLLAGVIIIASNAGGAWSPIGDVTTTMLWIGAQITPFNIMLKLFLPSLVCLVVPMLILSITMKGDFQRPQDSNENIPAYPTSETERRTVFFVGIIVLLLVPVFNAITNLPPYMGMLIGLGIVWIVTELLHKGKID